MTNLFLVLIICIATFLLGMIVSYSFFTYKARKKALKKRINYFDKDKKENSKISVSFSKRMFVLFSVNSLLLSITTVIVSFTEFDPTAISVITAASYGVDGTWGGFYLWKSKNENRAKYAQQFIRELANEYGIDAAIRVAELVLKE